VKIGIVGRSHLTFLLVTALHAACSDPAPKPDAPVDAAPDAGTALTIAPASFNFGEVELAFDEHAQQQFVVRNVSAFAVDITNVAIGGLNTSDFGVDTNSCGIALQPDDVCRVTVVFSPKAGELRDAQLEVTGPTVATAHLQGTGTVTTPRLLFEPSSRDFGDVGVGETSAAVAFIVHNELATGAFVASIEPAASAFSVVSTDCTATVPLHGTCTANVQWAPGYSGFHTAMLRVANGSASWQAGVRGTAARPLSVEPLSTVMGSMLVGQSEPTLSRTFTVTNTSTALTTGTLTPSFTGTGAAAYEVVSTTCTTLAPGASCEVVARLAPSGTSRGSKPAQLVVADGSATVAARAALTGSVYSVLIAPQSATTFDVVNASDTATSTLNVSVTSGFSITSNTCASGLADHGRCTITIQGTGTGTLTVSGSVGGSDTQAISG
jgi:hypothetical protein